MDIKFMVKVLKDQPFSNSTGSVVVKLADTIYYFNVLENLT